VTRETLEAGIRAIVRTWTDSLREALVESIGGTRARALGARYAEAFSAAYREAFDARTAIDDIATLERLSESRPRAVDLYRREGDPPTRINLKVFSRGSDLTLSERVPLLENLGLRVVNERTYRIVPGGERIWLHDMTLERAAGGEIDISAIERPIEAALLALLRGLGRVRRLQPAGARGGPGVARRRHGAGARPLSAPDPRSLRPGLHRGDARPPRPTSRSHRRPVLRPLRPPRGGRRPRAAGETAMRARSRRAWHPSRASTTTASCATS
jgi:hypothetical protein